MFKNTIRKFIEILSDGVEFEHPDQKSWDNSAEKYLNYPNEWYRFYILKETVITKTKDNNNDKINTNPNTYN